MREAESTARTRRRITGLCLAAVTALVLAACTSATPEKKDPPGPPATGNLYLSVPADAQGLHVLDTATGQATRVGQGQNGNATGLAPSRDRGSLFGTDIIWLVRVQRDGSAVAVMSQLNPLAEGLAYDPIGDVIYAAGNGYLNVRSVGTGEIVKDWMRPPNSPDVEGLAFDPESRTLYGLARGYSSHPANNQGLLALDVDAAAPAWTSAGSTSGLWENAALAFDEEAGVLYATGRQGDLGSLYRIDPATGATVRVGDTGLAVASGGMAWVR